MLKNISEKSENHFEDKLIFYLPFDEGKGRRTREMVSGQGYEIDYIFNNATSKKPDLPSGYQYV